MRIEKLRNVGQKTLDSAVNLMLAPWGVHRERIVDQDGHEKVVETIKKREAYNKRVKEPHIKNVDKHGVGIEFYDTKEYQATVYHNGKKE